MTSEQFGQEYGHATILCVLQNRRRRSRIGLSGLKTIGSERKYPHVPGNLRRTSWDLPKHSQLFSSYKSRQIMLWNPAAVVSGLIFTLMMTLIFVFAVRRSA